MGSHKVFIVCYASGENLDLSYHFDNAEVILNVTLASSLLEGIYTFEKRKMLGQVLLICMCTYIMFCSNNVYAIIIFYWLIAAIFMVATLRQ